MAELDLSYLEEADDPAELKRRTRDLHESMVSYGDSAFLPTTGVFLELPYERFMRLAGGSLPDDFSAVDATALYRIAHETVHVAQVVLSPWVFEHVKDVSTVAMETVHRHSRRELSPEWVEEARARVARAFAARDDEEVGVTVNEILETHAVVQGVKWVTRERDGKTLRWAAETFHEGAAAYLRMLRVFASLLGDDLAFELLPRVCALSLQDADPRLAFAYLFERIAHAPDREAVSRLSGADFCRWATADPEFIAASIRERDPSLQRERNPWTPLFSRYFDLFEQIGGTDERLEVILGSDFGARGAEIFRPWYALFGDGQVIALHDPEVNAQDYEQWTRVTLVILETLRFLTSTDRFVPAEPPS